MPKPPPPKAPKPKLSERYSYCYVCRGKSPDSSMVWNFRLKAYRHPECKDTK